MLTVLQQCLYVAGNKEVCLGLNATCPTLCLFVNKFGFYIQIFIVEEYETNLISQFIKFYFISSMLNMFRTLIHPSSGAGDFSILSPHWLCVPVSMCVGISVWLFGVVSMWQASQHVSDINKSIIRSLRLFYCIATLVVCSCFDVCWSFGVAGLGW